MCINYMFFHQLKGPNLIDGVGKSPQTVMTGGEI